MKFLKETRALSAEDLVEGLQEIQPRDFSYHNDP